jgi:hypothetical protein
MRAQLFSKKSGFFFGKSSSPPRCFSYNQLNSQDIYFGFGANNSSRTRGMSASAWSNEIDEFRFQNFFFNFKIIVGE